VEIIGCIKRALWFLSAGRYEDARKLWYVLFTMLVLYRVVEVPVRLCSPENWAVKNAVGGVKRNGSNEISEMCFWAHTKESSAYYSSWVIIIIIIIIVVRLNPHQLQWLCLQKRTVCLLFGGIIIETLRTNIVKIQHIWKWRWSCCEELELRKTLQVQCLNKERGGQKIWHSVAVSGVCGTHKVCFMFTRSATALYT
jgi:hypothetical protein